MRAASEGTSFFFCRTSPTRKAPIRGAIRCPARSVRVAAGKFTKIGDAAGASGGDASGEAPETPSPAKLEILGRVNDEGELAHDDDELPDNLFDAVATAAVARACVDGGGDCARLGQELRRATVAGRRYDLLDRAHARRAVLHQWDCRVDVRQGWHAVLVAGPAVVRRALLAHRDDDAL